MTQLEATLEAILFAAGDAVPVGRLAAAADAEPAQVAHALHGLAAHYAQSGSGIQLVRMEDKVQLCTRPAFAPAVRRATESRRPPALSAAALEVLTVVAYRQPVTRAYIEQLRGGCARTAHTAAHDRRIFAGIRREQPIRAAQPARAGRGRAAHVGGNGVTAQ